MPIPHRTEPLSIWCFRAAASRLGKRSSPSESFTTTALPSCCVSIGSPGEERLGSDLPAALDGLREAFRPAERGAHLPRAARFHDRHHVLEVPVATQRELRIMSAPAREV